MSRRSHSNGSIEDQLSPADTTGGAAVSRGILMRDPITADPKRLKKRLKQQELGDLIRREQAWLEHEIGNDWDPKTRKKIRSFLKELGRLAEEIQPEEPLRSAEELDELIERIRNLCEQTGRGLNDTPRVKNAVNDVRGDLLGYLQAHYALRAAAVLDEVGQGPDDTGDDTVDEPLSDTEDDALGDALDSPAMEPFPVKKMVSHMRGLVLGRLTDFVAALYAGKEWNVAEAITLEQVEALCRSFNTLADALENAVMSVVHEGEREVPLNKMQRAGMEVLRAFEIDKTGLASQACPHFKALVCVEPAELLALVAQPGDLADSLFAFPPKKRLELRDVQALFRPGPHRDVNAELTNYPWSDTESDFVAREVTEAGQSRDALATHLNEHFHGGVQVRTGASVDAKIRERRLETETMNSEEVLMRFRGAMISRLPSYVASLQADPGMRASLLPLKKETVQALYRFWNTILTWLDEQLQGWAEERQGYRFAMVKEGMLQWLSLKDELDEEPVEMMEGETLSREVQRFKECVWDWLRKQVEAAQTLEDFRNPPFVLYATEFSEDTVRQIFRPDAYADLRSARVVPMDDDQDAIIEQWDGTDPQAMVDRLNNDFHGGAPMWSIDMLQSYRAELDQRRERQRGAGAGEKRDSIPMRARLSGMLVRQLPEFAGALLGEPDIKYDKKISQRQLQEFLRACRNWMVKDHKKLPPLRLIDPFIPDDKVGRRIADHLRIKLFNPVEDALEKVVGTGSWGDDPSRYAPLEGNREISLEDFQAAFRPMERRAAEWPWSDEEVLNCGGEMKNRLEQWVRMAGLSSKRKRGGDSQGYTGFYTELAKVARKINRGFHGGASVRKPGHGFFVVMQVSQEGLGFKKKAPLDATQVKTLMGVLRDWIKNEKIGDIHSALGRREQLNELMKGVDWRKESSAVSALQLMQMFAILEQLFEEIEAEQASDTRALTMEAAANDASASAEAGAVKEFDPNAVSAEEFALRFEALIRRHLYLHLREIFVTTSTDIVSESSLEEMCKEFRGALETLRRPRALKDSSQVESYEKLRQEAYTFLNETSSNDGMEPLDPESTEGSDVRLVLAQMRKLIGSVKSQFGTLDPKKFMDEEEFAPFDAPLALADIQNIIRPSDYRTGLPEAALNLTKEEYDALERLGKMKSKKRKGRDAASELNKTFHGGAPVWSNDEVETYIERRKRGEAAVSSSDVDERLRCRMIRRIPVFVKALKEEAGLDDKARVEIFLNRDFDPFLKAFFRTLPDEGGDEGGEEEEREDFWVIRREILRFYADLFEEIDKKNVKTDSLITAHFAAQVLRPVMQELRAMDTMETMRRFLKEPLEGDTKITREYLRSLFKEPELLPREREMLVMGVGAQINRFTWGTAAECTVALLSEAMTPVLDQWAVTLTRAFHAGTATVRTSTFLQQALPAIVEEVYAKRAVDAAEAAARVARRTEAEGAEGGGPDDGAAGAEATGDEPVRPSSGAPLEPHMRGLPWVAPVGAGQVERVDPALVEEVRGLAMRVDMELRAVEAAGWARTSIPHKMLAVVARQVLSGDLPHTTAQLVLYREFLQGFRALFEINDPHGRPSLREAARGDFERGFMDVMIRLGQLFHLNDFDAGPGWAALVNLMQSRQRQREEMRQAIEALRAEVAHRPEAVERELRVLRDALQDASGEVRPGLQDSLAQLTREHTDLQAKQQALTDLEAQEARLRDRHTQFLERLQDLIEETLTATD